MSKLTAIFAMIAVVAVAAAAFVVIFDDSPPSDDSVVLTTNVSGSLKEYTYDKGAVIEAPQAPALEDGFIFKGWTTDLENIDDLYDFSKPLTSDKVLYAVIIAVQPDYDPNDNNHLIQFKYNLKTVPMSYSFVRHMDKASFPEPADVKGYEFDAWYTDRSFTELVNLNLPIMEKTTFYGKYVSNVVNNNTIYIDCGLGSVDGSKLLTKTVQSGTTFQTVFDSVDPICDNYLFDGWYYDKTFSSRVVPSDTITKDVYIYANWTPTLDVFRYFGTQMDDVLDITSINPDSVHVDNNTIYVRLATVTGDVISSSNPTIGTGEPLTLKSSSTTISAYTVSSSICNTYEETIRTPNCPISGVEVSVGVPNLIEASAKFDIDFGDKTVRTLEQYIAESSQSGGNALSYGVECTVQSINGMWYRIVHTTVYQIIQCIEVTDLSDPLNPVFTSEYRIMMEPLVIQVQCSDSSSFKSTIENGYYALEDETIIDLIGEYIIGSSRPDMNEVIFHSELGDDGVRYKYIGDGETISDDSSNYFSKEGYWIAGWSDTPTSSYYFSRESIVDPDTLIYDDMDLFAIWLPDRLKDKDYTLICNQEELSKINEDLGGYYVLANDLKLTSSWTPIGSTPSGTRFFDGTFDGANYTILGLSITKSFEDEWISSMGDGGDHYAFAGLFAKLGSRSEVCNVVFEKAVIKPGLSKNWMCAGVLAGYATGSNIHDVIVRNSEIYFNNTKAKAIMGGIVGIVEGNTTISDCIVGNEKINNSDVSVYGKGSRATSGGIAGSLEEGGCTITCCINHARVEANGSSDSGYAAAGGIAGAMKFGGDKKVVSYCYSDGVIETHSYGDRYSAGIVGKAWPSNPDKSSINHCWILKDVYLESDKKVGNYTVDGGRNDDVEVSDNNNFSFSDRYQLTNWFKEIDNKAWNEVSDLRCDSIGYRYYLIWEM